MLVAFGADVNIVSGDDLTPTELCKLKSILATPRDAQQSLDTHQATPPPDLPSDIQTQVEEKATKEESETQMTKLMRDLGGIVRIEQTPSADKASYGQSNPMADLSGPGAYDENSNARKQYNELYDALRRRARSMSSLGPDSRDLAFIEKMQRIELTRFQQTGSRILCLDGGGDERTD